MAANQNVTQLTQQAGTADTTSLFYAVTGGALDTGLPFSVLVNSLGLTGTPTAPTAAIATNTTQIATTAFVHSYAAPLASPTFTGVPAAPTAASGTNTTQVATTAYVITSYASPPAIGSTTPAAGSFTTIGSSGLATLSSLSTSSATITGGSINSTAIGATTPSSGKFTTLTATGAITPATTVGIVGTTLADNAQAGSVGEFLTASATGVSQTSATLINITSLTLTAGDWDVSYAYAAAPAGTTTVQGYNFGLTTTTGAQAPQWQRVIQAGINTAAGSGGEFTGAPVRFNVSSSTTVFLTAATTFSVSTLTGSGIINARRRR